ncbi:MAG: rRNA maturation RNase YbeY [Candidatus Nealsonbacteria bacterium]
MIEVNNLAKEKVSEDFLKKIAQKVLGKKKLDLSIVIVGQDRIKELNIKYRKTKGPTDVLAFFYGDLAEIILCLPQIRKNAREYKTDFKEELTRILIHGLLHVLGHNHKNKSEAVKMEKKEKEYLFKIHGKK